MTVVFDGSILGPGQVTGVGRAFLNALEAYSELDATPNAVLLLPNGTPAPRLRETVDIVHGMRPGLRDRMLRMPRQLRELRAGVLHSPVVAIPTRAGCRVIATVHDLPWMAQPRVEGERRATSARARWAVRLAAHSADALLCVSRTTRRDLIRFLGKRPRARASVVPNGTARIACETASTEQGSGPLITFADHGRARKNTARVKRAHALALREAGSIVPPLEVLGPPDNYVSETQKHTKLARARALLHVTLFDGFGLPVVEAFQHGVPVICSDRGALPEIACDGTALRVDPTDEAAIASAIVRVCTDTELRASLRANGLARGACFTPERTAQAWLRTHLELLA